MSAITLHVLPPSHPCAAADAALALKGLEYERVELPMDGTHIATMEAIYGDGNSRVPGAVIDGDPVYGSNPIFERIDALAPDAHPLYPEPIAEQVRAAAAWGDEVLQPIGRTLPWGALHFRPDALGLIVGGDALDAAGCDFALKMVRVLWRRHEVSCARIAAELQALPGHRDHIDSLIDDGIIGTDHVNAADLQIGATLSVLLAVGDSAGLFADEKYRRIAETVGLRAGQIPAGAFPPGWVPAG
ncbi:MAG: glutathione S-transferase N-terminal domain-containing protein [Baekduia sp.]